MSEQGETTRHATGQLTESLERVWDEIKEISKQVERETRRSGRRARLRLDLRRLRREVFEVRARLGKAVYEAHCEHGDDITLSEVEGYAGGVAALDALQEQIRAKEEEAERLSQAGDRSAGGNGSGEVAHESATG